MEPTRRDFLATGGAALLGVALVACTGSKPKDKPVANPTTMAELTRGKAATLQVSPVQPNIKRSRDRLALGLLSTDGTKPYSGGTARAWVAASETSKLIGPVDLTFHSGGAPAGVYVGRVSFPTAGRWLVFVEAKPDGVATTLQNGAVTQVGTEGPTSVPGKSQPIPGQHAKSTPTPTKAKPLGVSPICTHKPVCPMHQISLDQALASHKPVVLIIGTPAFCQSRTCGPVLDQLIAVQPTFKSTVHFVHIEVYKNDTDAPAKQILSPAAAAWNLEAEPAIYYIRRNGVIADWTVGASDSAEMTALTRALL